MTRRLLLGSIAVIGAVGGFVLGLYLEFLLLPEYSGPAHVFTVAITGASIVALAGVGASRSILHRSEPSRCLKPLAIVCALAAMAALAAFVKFVAH